MQSVAVFSPNGAYRYQLIRRWEPTLPLVTFIGLNPSRADASYTDPTIRRCIQFAQSWGYGGIIMANLFAFRTPHPEALKQCTKPVGPENDWYIKDALRRSSLTIVAWGNDGRFRQRDKKVLSWIASPMCLRVNKSGQPAHPLYIPAKTTPLPFVLS